MAPQSVTQARVDLIRAATRNPTIRARLAQAGLLTRTTPLFVRWTLLLFILTIPLEALNLAFTSGGATFTRLTGLLFAGLYFLYHNPLAQRPLPRISPAMWCFLLYLTVHFMHMFFIPEGMVRTFIGGFGTLVQLVVLFWILADLLKNTRSRSQALLVYCAGCALAAVGVILDLPGFSTTAPAAGAALARETLADMGPNIFAIYLALGFVLLMGFLLGTEFKSILIRGTLVVATLPILLLIVRTGSRTGIGAAAIGCSTYLLPLLMAKISKLKRSTALIVGLLGIIGIGFVVASNPDVLERWQQAFYEQKLSGRERIIPTGIEMIVERPLFGWHPGEHSQELGFRLGNWKGKGGHNLILDLLLEVGIIGAIPALLGLWFCFKGAWIARRGAAGLLPLAAFLTVMAGSMGNPFFARKPLWFVLALAVAGARVALAERTWFKIASSRRLFRNQGLGAK